MRKVKALLTVLCVCLTVGAFSACGNNNVAEKGEDGKSAYEIWLANGHSGTETDFLEWLKGEKGEQGEQGIQGEKGDKGEQGEQGIQGEKGEQGVGIEKVEYDADGNLVITYSDGTKQTVIMPKEEHTHNWGEGIVLKEATESEQGAKIYICACGEIKRETLPALHYSKGLAYTLNDDGESYSVTGIDTCMDRDIVIPSIYEGLPVTSIGDYAFEDCDLLTNVEIPDSVTSIGYGAFYKTAYYNNESNWEDGVLYIEEYLICANDDIASEYTIKEGTICIAVGAFEDCDSLISVVIPDFVKCIGDAPFIDCDSLTNITVSEDNDAYQSIDGNLYSKDGKALIQYSIGKTDASFTIPNSVTSIGFGAFSECTSLTSIVIPDSVTSIGYGAFCNCTSLTSVVIPDSVTSIGDYAFAWCDSLTSVEMGDSVTSIGDSAFEGCTSLTSVVIPDSVTSIGKSAFYGCDKLVEVYNKSSLPITVGSSGYGKVGYYAKNVYTPTSGASKLSTTDDGYILYADGEIVSLMGYIGTETNLAIPESVTEIYRYAFYACDSLTSVEIPDSVMRIGDDAFYGCPSLTSVVIPDSVTSIGDFAFSSCYYLTSVYYHGTAEEWDDISIGSGNSDLTNATRYYYSETETSGCWRYVDGVPTIW